MPLYIKYGDISGDVSYRVDTLPLLQPDEAYWIVAGDGSDTIALSAGVGTGTVEHAAEGGAGKDRIFGNAAPNILYGDDSELYGASGLAARDTILGGDETALGGGSLPGDTIYGGGGGDVLAGMGGDDVIDGGSGRDRLNGGPGADTVSGGDDRDRTRGAGGNDLVLGGAGPDRVRGDSGRDTVLGGGRGDILIGGGGRDSLGGGAGADFLNGGSARDTIRGGDGDDWISGHGGRDLLSGGAGADRFYFSDAREGPDTILRYEPGVDRIVLGHAGFGLTLAPGGSISNPVPIDAAEFGVFASIELADASTARIVFVEDRLYRNASDELGDTSAFARFKGGVQIAAGDVNVF